MEVFKMNENDSSDGLLIVNGTIETQISWIAATSSDAVCFLLSLWIFVSFLSYGIKRRKFSNRRKSVRTLYISACASAFSATVYLPIKIALDLPWKSNKTCDVLSEIAVELYVISTSFVYLFLWIKQRSLYQKRLLKDLYKGWAVVISYLSVILMIFALNSAAVVFNVINEYGSSVYGCTHLNRFHTWPFLVGSAINATGQGMMLVLFIYPLKIAKNKSQTGTGFRLLKRSLVITVMCIISDAVTGVVNAFVPFSFYRTPFIAYGPTTALNLIGVMLTFDTWKEIIMNPLYGGRPLQRGGAFSRSQTRDS